MAIICLAGGMMIGVKSASAQNAADQMRLDAEPNAIIDWSVLDSLMPQQDRLDNLPLAPAAAPRSGIRQIIPLTPRTDIGLASPQNQGEAELPARAKQMDQQQKRQPEKPIQAFAPPSLPATIDAALAATAPNASNAGDSPNAGDQTAVIPDPPPAVAPPAVAPPPTQAQPSQAQPSPPAADKTEQTRIAALPPAPAAKLQGTPESTPAIKAQPEQDLLLRIPYAVNMLLVDEKIVPELTQLADMLIQNPSVKIALNSYAGNEDQTDLDRAEIRRAALRRAQNLRDYLMEQGVDRQRIILKPLGADASPQGAGLPNHVDILKVQS
ncbi:MAG: hypothetical protein AB8B77_06495 [Alphaproteobacteria bacterium]